MEDKEQHEKIELCRDHYEVSAIEKTHRKDED